MVDKLKLFWSYLSTDRIFFNNTSNRIQQNWKYEYIFFNTLLPKGKRNVCQLTLFSLMHGQSKENLPKAFF